MPWRRRLTLLAGLAAALPLILATVHAVSGQWTPYGDRAVIAVRAFDVLGAHSPLVGQYTQFSELLGRPIYSPGPLLYWLLAIPARWLPVVALPIWMAAFNLACVLGIVVLARRRGGTPLMLATAIAIALMGRSLGSETFHDIWNPSTALLPFALLCLCAWSVGGGEVELLPLVAFLASFIVQTHLTYVAPAAGLVVIAMIGMWRASASRPPVLSTLLVVIVCWAAPVADQIAGTGNLGQIARAALHGQGSLGLHSGYDAIVRTIGIAPWWLGHPLNAIQRLADVTQAPGLLAQVSAVLMLLGLVAALIAGLRARRAPEAAGAAVALVAVFAVGAGTAATPTQDLLRLTVGYTLWWASPAGMVVWLIAAWRLGVLIAGAPGVAGRVAAAGDRLRVGPLDTPRLGPAPVASAAGVIVALAAGVLIAAGQPRDGDRGEYRPFHAVAVALDRALPRPGAVLVSADRSLQGLELSPEVVFTLQRAGATVYTGDDAVPLLGSRFRRGHRRVADRLDVVFDHRAPAGSRRIVRVRVGPPSPVSVGTFTVALTRH